MAKFHKIFRPFINNLMTGNIPDLSSAGTTLKVALLYQNAVPTSYVFNAAHADWGDVKAFECTDTDYTTGGHEITNKTVSTSGDIIKLDTTMSPKSTQFTAEGNIKAVGAVLYVDTGATDADKYLMSYFDFFGEEESQAGEFKITWHADGIISIDVSGA